jgi:hypothetical protein
MSGDGKAGFLRPSMAAVEEKGNDASTAKTLPFAVVSCSSQVHARREFLACLCRMSRAAFRPLHGRSGDGRLDWP